MTTATVPSTTAETARKAADLIADNGLFVDTYWHPSAVEWQPGMPLCPVAAVGVARGWTRVSDVCHHVAGQGRRSRVDPAVTALLQHLDFDNVGELYDWVSARAGEVGRVVALLRAVADEQATRKRVLDFSYQAGGAA